MLASVASSFRSPIMTTQKPDWRQSPSRRCASPLAAARRLAQKLPYAQARRPVAHEEEERLALDRTPHRDEITRLGSWQPGHLKRNGGAAFQLEDIGPVVETDIDAAGTGESYARYGSCRERVSGLGDHIFHHRTVRSPKRRSRRDNPYPGGNEQHAPRF